MLRSDFNREEDNEQPEIANWMEELFLHGDERSNEMGEKWMWRGGQMAQERRQFVRDSV